MEGPTRYNLKWKSHHSESFHAFEVLRAQEALVDVTLSSGGQLLKAHKIILSAGSGYFERIFQHAIPQYPVAFHIPIIHFHGIPPELLVLLLDFLYNGEVNVPIEHLEEFVCFAESLEVRGLTMEALLAKEENLASVMQQQMKKRNKECVTSTLRPIPIPHALTSNSPDTSCQNGRDHGETAPVTKRTKCPKAEQAPNSKLSKKCKLSDPTEVQKDVTKTTKEESTGDGDSEVQHELKARVIQDMKEETQNGEIEDAACDSDEEQMLETEDEKEDEHQMMAWVVANPEIVMEEATDAVQSTNQDDILKETLSPIQPRPNAKTAPDKRGIWTYEEHGYKIFCCMHCSYQTERRSAAVRHMVVHSQEKPFACDQCHKNFKRRHHLQRHARQCHSHESKGIGLMPHLLAGGWNSST